MVDAIRIGDVVSLQGLVSRSDLNGQEGVICKLHAGDKGDRFGVRIGNLESLRDSTKKSYAKEFYNPTDIAVKESNFVLKPSTDDLVLRGDHDYDYGAGGIGGHHDRGSASGRFLLETE